jgi:hypothetical protein
MIPTVSRECNYFRPAASVQITHVHQEDRKLHFTIEAIKETEGCFFVSMNYMFTYSRLLRTLDPFPKQLLCETPLGHKTYVVRLGNSSSPLFKILCLARQHPGETVSSYVMEGILNFLSSSAPEVVWLLSHA